MHYAFEYNGSTDKTQQRGMKIACPHKYHLKITIYMECHSYMCVFNEQLPQIQTLTTVKFYLHF